MIILPNDTKTVKTKYFNLYFKHSGNLVLPLNGVELVIDLKTDIKKYIRTGFQIAFYHYFSVFLFPEIIKILKQEEIFKIKPIEYPERIVRIPSLRSKAFFLTVISNIINNPVKVYDIYELGLLMNVFKFNLYFDKEVNWNEIYF